MDPTGNQVVLGYADGVVRLFALESEQDPTNLRSGTMYRLTKALSARFDKHYSILRRLKCTLS
jgi:hypothetical protein